MLLLHKNYPIDLQTKATEWFLYNGDTANSRRHLFWNIDFNLIEDILHHFPQVQPSQTYFTKTT